MRVQVSAIAPGIECTFGCPVRCPQPAPRSNVIALAQKAAKFLANLTAVVGNFRDSLGELANWFHDSVFHAARLVAKSPKQHVLHARDKCFEEAAALAAQGEVHSIDLAEGLQLHRPSTKYHPVRMLVEVPDQLDHAPKDL